MDIVLTFRKGTASGAPKCFGYSHLDGFQRRHVVSQGYNSAKNFLIRSTPRSNSLGETAYESRMCSLVPNPSPGTVTTWASCSSFRATSAALLIPALPKNAETLGYT